MEDVGAGTSLVDVPRGAPLQVERARITGPKRPPVDSRVRVDGKFFAAGDQRFPFRGVTYGTFRTRSDGALFPPSERIRADLDAMAAAGFTVLRTYTPPPDDLLELASDARLRVFAGAFYSDWRYLVGDSRHERRRIMREARSTVRDAARRVAGDPTVLALSLGNEIPADVVRWVGAAKISRFLGELAQVAREEDPELLVSYGNYPTTEYLSLDALDFVTFNVFLERPEDFRAYLTRLHNLAGDRPVVLGEIGLDAGQGDDAQASTLDWQLEVATERGIAGTCLFSWTDEWAVADRPVEGWQFGLTREDRSPRPALEVATTWNRRKLVDLRPDWPSMSIVICAHNAESTLGECLAHTCALDYPGLEVVVVDDGSTDATAATARAHPRARLISVPAGGLSRARNVGATAATGEIVAYLDSDAFPPPEWPYLLVLGFDRPAVGGVGGPNLPPIDDPLVAQAVARSPGGPVHVLVSDDRAEHIPGCNMAFWRELIDEVGGFDPLFTAAGDDVDFCWRLLADDWQIGFHPAAFVWHRRRARVSQYVRQQTGYGRAEALVQSRHPERFTPIGTARWRGSIYAGLVPRMLRQRIYHGVFGSAAFQSVYRDTGHGLDIAHQLGVPLAALALLAAPAFFLLPVAGLVALCALLFLLGLAAVDAFVVPLLRGGQQSGRLRLLVAALHVLQPLARVRGRISMGLAIRRNGSEPVRLPGPVQRQPGGVLLIPLERSRPELAEALVSVLRSAGFRVSPGSAFDAFDAHLPVSALIEGQLVTSAHPEGSVQLRVRRRARVKRCIALGLTIAALALSAPAAAAALAAVGAADAAFGLWRTGNGARRAIADAALASG